jgi:hypothetical protein
MPETVIPKIKGLLFNPAETFRNSRVDDTRTVVSFFGVLLLLLAGLYAVFEMAMLFLAYLLSTGSSSGMYSGENPEMALAMVVVVPMIAFFAIIILVSVFMLIFSLWTHLWVFLLGGKNGFRQTLHASLYSMTPNLLLGWIPLAGMIAPFWTLILFFFGIRELQEMSDNRTVSVILLSVFLPLGILALLLIAAILYFMSSGGLFSPGSSLR